MDTHCPWFQLSNLPYLTWNLTVQLSYYALQPGNRLALAEGLFHALDTHRDALRRTAATVAPGAAAIGHVTQQDLESPMEVDRRYEREWGNLLRSEEHTSELQSLMRSSYAVFCLKKKNNRRENTEETAHK